MESSQRATVGGALVLGVMVAVLAIGLAPGVAAQETNGTEGGNASFGAQVSAFMQSSAADANGSVDRGMWEGAVDDAGNPGAAVSERARELEQRVDRLEDRSAELAAQADESGPASVVYTARASAVRAELANLRRSVDQTAATADRSGVDDDQLSELRRRSGNVSGPEVAAGARNLTDGGPPDDVPGGPDGDPGPPTDRPGADPGNRTDGDGPGAGGPPDDRGNGGPPDDRGSGDSAESDGDRGAPNEGNGNSPDNAGDGNSGDGSEAGGGPDDGDGADDGGAPGNSGDSSAGSGGPGNSGGGGSGGSDGGSGGSGGPGNGGGSSGGGPGNGGGQGGQP